MSVNGLPPRKVITQPGSNKEPMRRKGLLDGLIGGEALAFTGIDDRADSRKQITSPLGAKPIRDLPEHGAHANGLLAGVVRGWNGGVIQEQEQVVANLGIAFLQPSAMGVGGLAELNTGRHAAGDHDGTETAWRRPGCRGVGESQTPAAGSPSCAGQTWYPRPRSQIGNPAVDGPNRPASPRQGGAAGHCRDRRPRWSVDGRPGFLG